MSENIYYPSTAGTMLPLTGGTLTGDLTLNTQLVEASANGASWTSGQSSEILAVSTSATTDTAGFLLPANSEIKAVTVRVLAAIPTAATFNVGDATTAARFATGVAVAVTTTAVGLIHVGSTGVLATTPLQVAAAKVRITPNIAPGTSTGSLRITTFWETFVAPTS